MKTFKLFTHRLLLILISFGTLSYCAEESKEIKPIKLNRFTPKVRTAFASIRSDTLEKIGKGICFGSGLAIPTCMVAIYQGLGYKATIVFGASILVGGITYIFALDAKSKIKALERSIKYLEDQSKDFAQQYKTANELIAKNKNLVNMASFLLDPTKNPGQNQPELNSFKELITLIEDDKLNFHCYYTACFDMEKITQEKIIQTSGYRNYYYFDFIGNANIEKITEFNEKLVSQKDIFVIQQAIQRKEYEKIKIDFNIFELRKRNIRYLDPDFKS